MLFLLCISCATVLAQDERFYRSMFNGVLKKKISPTPYKIKVFGPKYMIDLDRDGIEDSFQAVKKDGIDFIRLNNAYGELQFEAQLDTKGHKSSIFKANFMRVNDKVDVLVLHFYEGETQSSTFEGSARLYFVTILNHKLEQVTFTKGPFFWSEKEKTTGQYWNRRYTVNLIDYNKDGQKEISVSYNRISRIYYYVANGVWRQI